MKTKHFSLSLFIILTLFLSIYSPSSFSQPSFHVGSITAEPGSVVQVPVTADDFNTVTNFQFEINISDPSVAQIIGFSIPQQNALILANILNPSTLRANGLTAIPCVANNWSHDPILILDIQILPGVCDTSQILVNQSFTEIVLTSNCEVPFHDSQHQDGTIQIADGCLTCEKNTSVSVSSANPNNLLQVIMNVESPCVVSYPVNYQGYDNNGNVVVTGILSNASSAIGGFPEMGEYNICYEFVDVESHCDNLCSYTICEDYFIGCEGLPAPSGTQGFIKPGTKYAEPPTAFLSWNSVHQDFSYEIQYVNGNIAAEDCCANDFSNAQSLFVARGTSVSFESTCCFSWRVRAICVNGTPGPWSDIQCTFSTSGNCARSPHDPTGDDGGISSRSIHDYSLISGHISMMVSPMPVKNLITFSSVPQRKLTGEIHLFDSNGIKVFNLTFRDQPEIKANLSGLPSGIYFYRYINNQQVSSSGKIIIQ